MKLKLYKALWGMTGRLEDQVKMIAEAGYHGIETPPPEPANQAVFRSLLDQYSLEFMGCIFTQGNNTEEHLQSFRDQLKNNLPWKPVKVITHSMRDFYPLAEQVKFYREAVKIEKDTGIHIGHETHRGRSLYSPWSTRAIVEAVPDLHLNIDFSHWCAVTETSLEEFQEEIQISARRAVHIHGRVGHPQGPQVADPRAPEYAELVDKHFSWWDSVVNAQIQRGDTDTITFDPEFGPPGYMPTLPFTRQPVADLWEVCLWMANRFRDHFKEKFGD